MPWQARLDAPGTLHHIIIGGIEQRKIVDDRKDRENFVERLGRAALETKTSIYAWALMPNHFHGIIVIGRAGSRRAEKNHGLSEIVRQFNLGI